MSNERFRLQRDCSEGKIQWYNKFKKHLSGSFCIERLLGDSEAIDLWSDQLKLKDVALLVSDRSDLFQLEDFEAFIGNEWVRVESTIGIQVVAESYLRYSFRNPNGLVLEASG